MNARAHLRIAAHSIPEQNDLPRPTLKWTLSEYFFDFYVPTYCDRKPSEKPANERTIKERRTAVERFVAEFGDLPLGEITEQTLVEYQSHLTRSTYAKDKFGRNHRPLRIATQEKHIREIVIVMRSTGFTGRVKAKLQPDPPTIAIESTPSMPKDNYFPSEISRIFQAAKRLPKYRRIPDAEQYRRLAQTTIAAWYFLGYRALDCFAIRAADIMTNRRGESYFRLRAMKSGKVRIWPCHAQLRELLESATTDATANLMQLWSGYTYATIADHWKDWQISAGFQSGQLLPPQSIRSTHAEATSDAEHLQDVMQDAMQHSSATTTKRFYADAHRLSTFALPRLGE